MVRKGITSRYSQTAALNPFFLPLKQGIVDNRFHALKVLNLGDLYFLSILREAWWWEKGDGGWPPTSRCSQSAAHSLSFSLSEFRSKSIQVYIIANNTIWCTHTYIWISIKMQMTNRGVIYEAVDSYCLKVFLHGNKSGSVANATTKWGGGKLKLKVARETDTNTNTI